MWVDYKVQVELLEPLLGTIPKNNDIYADFVADKERAQDDEILPAEVEERGWTGFYTDDAGRPVVMDYQVKGFLKEAGNVLKDILGVKALRSHIEASVFVNPRRMVLGEAVDGVVERPLRAMTMQGPRVSLVRSDFIAAGKTYDFTFKVLEKSKVTEAVLAGVLEYGMVKGLGQWRNGGYGRFAAKLERA